MKDVQCDLVSIDDVLESGMLALKDKWKLLNFSTSNPLYIQENNILTLTENDSIRVVYDDIGSGSDIITTSNELVDIPNNVREIYYTLYGESEELLSMYQVIGSTWKIRSLLRINVSENEPQVINDGVENIDENTIRQSVLFYRYDETLEEDVLICTLQSQYQYFNLNTELHTDGNIVDTSITVDKEKKYPVAMYCYTLLVDDNGDEIIPNRNLSGYDTTHSFESGDTTICEYNVPIITYLDDSDNFVVENSVIMIHLHTNNSGDVEITATNCGIRQYNADTSDNNPFESSYTLVPGINVIEIKWDDQSGSIPSIKIDNDGNSGNVTFGTLDYFKGLNSALSFDTFANAITSHTKNELENMLLDEIRDQKFYYNCKIDNTKALEYDDILSPYAFYDANNRANKFTISQIDFDNSDIDVVKSSRL